MDICGKDFWVEQQRGREYVRDAGELIALVPGEFSEHGFLRGHMRAIITRKRGPRPPSLLSVNAGGAEGPEARTLNRRGSEIPRFARHGGGWGLFFVLEGGTLP